MENGKKGMLGILINGGAISLALVAMYFAWSLASNHIAHNTEVLIEVREASRASVSATGELTDVIRELNFIIRK